MRASKAYRKPLKEEIRTMTEVFIKELPEAEYLKAMEPFQPLLDNWENAVPRSKVTIESVVEHIVYIADLIGVKHVGFGSDFDGITFPPIDLYDCSRFPVLVQALGKKGFTDAEIENISWKNFARILQTVCPA